MQVSGLYSKDPGVFHLFPKSVMHLGRAGRGKRSVALQTQPCFSVSALQTHSLCQLSFHCWERVDEKVWMLTWEKAAEAPAAHQVSALAVEK